MHFILFILGVIFILSLYFLGFIFTEGARTMPADGIRTTFALLGIFFKSYGLACLINIPFGSPVFASAVTCIAFGCFTWYHGKLLRKTTK
jgi:hypothetical protein